MRTLIFFAILFASIQLMDGKIKVTKPIGLQLYSIRQDISENLLASLDSVSAIGYSFVETAGYKNGLFYGLKPEEFAKELKQRNLQFLSSHAATGISSLGSYESELRWWDEAIIAHKAAGVKYLVMPSLNNAFAFKGLAELKHYCNYMNAIGKKCSEAGLKFGFHNHSREFEKVEGQVAYDFMLANTQPKYVFFQIDLYWAYKGNVVIADYFKKYPKRFTMWHIKDEKEIGASGKIDFNSIFKHTKIAGVKHIVVEQEEFSLPRFESIRQSFEYLQEADFVKVPF